MEASARHLSSLQVVVRWLVIISRCTWCESLDKLLSGGTKRCTRPSSASSSPIGIKLGASLPSRPSSQPRSFIADDFASSPLDKISLMCLDPLPHDLLKMPHTFPAPTSSSHGASPTQGNSHAIDENISNVQHLCPI